MASEYGTRAGGGRPVFHLTAPKGWLNDPCAPGYDAETGLYHLFYQWNPHSHRWDNISWGHATSPDLIRWQHSSEDKPVLQPDQEYDQKGIFTGCLYSTGCRGETDELSIFYTNVKYLPISWDQPYTRGCEGLALATSKDGGQTWHKHSENPILSEEPPDIHVTGFRDPFLARWPAMDKARGSAPQLYGLISGGIHGQGPRTFMYTISPTDLTTWEYLHPLVVDIPSNHTPAGRWGGDLGANWECTNFITLRADDGTDQTIIIAGAEGGLEQSHVAEYHKVNPGRARRTPRYANWFFGNLVENGTGPRLGVGAAGLLDWGLAYAANSFVAPDGRILLWSWLIEEDLDDTALAERGWTGCMGVPRELYLQSLNDVTGGLRSSLDEIKSINSHPVGSQRNITTLGIRPLSDLKCLRGPHLELPRIARLEDQSMLLVPTAPLACEICLVAKISDTTQSTALILRHDQDRAYRTTISIDWVKEQVVVDRHNSTASPTVNTAPEIGPFTLFRQVDPVTDHSTIESLDLRVFLDQDVIEIFLNERFAMATRVYTDVEYTGISLGSVGPMVVDQLGIWPLDREPDPIM